MPLGPFDRRKKRSRCVACSASHLKCSGTLPCSSCQRKHIICEFSPAPSKTFCIKIDNGTPTSKSIGLPGSIKPAKTNHEYQTQLVKNPQNDKSFYFYSYFNTFLSKNKFNQQSMFFSDVGELMQHSASGAYLRDAVLSLGAMQGTKLGSLEGVSLAESCKFAFYHYSKSVMGLRRALDQFAKHRNLRHSILWTTHLLGLFELMGDATGQGWLQHLVHGTSRALVATGPLAFQSGSGKRFFMEIKIFEVCRAIIFNETSFLANPDWRCLSSKLHDPAEDYESHRLDALLDIIVLCSTLRTRADKLIYLLEQDEFGDCLGDARSIAIEGFCLREALTIWRETQGTPSQKLDSETGASLDDAFQWLAAVFFSASSIYLSGVFDYEMMHWQRMGILVPNLSEGDIQLHVSTILALSGLILETTNVSPLLVLFPLRIAGARSWETWQQECILIHLEKIELSFPVALAFKSELWELWARRGG
ncbi:hypothetical protein FZEAL_7669 [Fusarium zealandicum]|uniref:Zn(2)-C6 fungal-type domain-containing protein n=1 Tax=Fusarium zealandicum TaxID=1053134 RepID=A0A8H4UFE4_9HYPO|nr:hypothetical protein FZEAL_7669 [Fusarium zealandicum]